MLWSLVRKRTAEPLKVEVVAQHFAISRSRIAPPRLAELRAQYVLVVRPRLREHPSVGVERQRASTEVKAVLLSHAVDVDVGESVLQGARAREQLVIELEGR